MLRESLCGMIDGQPGIEVEMVEPDPLELLAAVERIEADVVVITMPDSGTDPGLCSHLLAEYPDLLVIALSPAGEDGYVYRQVITKEELEPLTEKSLLAAIRGRQETGHDDCSRKPTADEKQAVREPS